MRRIKILLICIFTLAPLLFVLYYNYGVFTPYNYFTAHRDLQNGVIQIITYGEPSLNQKIEALTAKEFGFVYKGIGCSVSQPLINGINQYNKIVYLHISKKNGENWQYKFQKEIRANDSY